MHLTEFIIQLDKIRGFLASDMRQANQHKPKHPPEATMAIKDTQKPIEHYIHTDEVVYALKY